MLTFPLALADFRDKLPIESAPFQPIWQQEVSGLGSGELLMADLGPRLVEASVTLKPVKNIAARPLQALLEAAAEGTFYFYDPTACYPSYDPAGTILGSHTVTVLSVNADGRRIALQGLPEGYVLDGDAFAVDYGSPTRRALLRIVGSVTAGSDGETAQFEVRPFLRPGMAAGDAVWLKKPSIKARIVPGSVSIDIASTTTKRISFRIRQTLQAG